MQVAKLSITVTSPFFITADGDFTKQLFAGEVTNSRPSESIHMSTRRVGRKDNPKFDQIKGDIFGIEFVFSAPEMEIDTLCKYIATEIFQHESFSPGLRILVNGSKTTSVVSLSGLGATELAEPSVKSSRIVNYSDLLKQQGITAAWQGRVF